MLESVTTHILDEISFNACKSFISTAATDDSLVGRTSSHLGSTGLLQASQSGIIPAGRSVSVLGSGNVVSRTGSAAKIDPSITPDRLAEALSRAALDNRGKMIGIIKAVLAGPGRPEPESRHSVAVRSGDERPLSAFLSLKCAPVDVERSLEVSVLKAAGSSCDVGNESGVSALPPGVATVDEGSSLNFNRGTHEEPVSSPDEYLPVMGLNRMWDTMEVDVAAGEIVVRASEDLRHVYVVLCGQGEVHAGFGKGKSCASFSVGEGAHRPH
jgi:hypothetical protein